MKISHDDDHIRLVDSLIPKAARYANKLKDNWDRNYIEKMNELAVAEGLRVPIESLLEAKRRIENGL